MSRILFYYPSNKRSVQIETTLIELQRLGHSVILLTTCKKGALHKRLEEENIFCFENQIENTRIKYYFNQIKFLVSFVKKNNIDYVFGNLQHTNFIAVLSQYFFKAKVISFRHHFKFSNGNFGIPLNINKNEQIFDRIINLLSKEIVVPSKGVYDGMKKYENVNMDKVRIIPYLYDFTMYKSPNPQKVKEIIAKFPCTLRIIMVARLIPFKRHLLALPTFKKLIDEGFDIQVLILDEGPEKRPIEEYIVNNKLSERIHLIGFTTQFIDYMQASDLLIHPSITEASNNVVKEIGLLKKVVAVCEGVGDFDDYINDGVNGFLMDIENPENSIIEIVTNLYQNPGKRMIIGQQLSKTITTNFGDNRVPLKLYEDLIS